MRLVILFVCFLSCSSILFAQELEGEWKGTFTEETTGFKIAEQTDISLIFTKINDTTFQAFSKTIISNGKEKDSSIYILQGSFSKINVLNLEEIRALRTWNNEDVTTCKQIMELYYYKEKKKLELSGFWHTENNKCGSGRITLFKKQ